MINATEKNRRKGKRERRKRKGKFYKKETGGEEQKGGNESNQCHFIKLNF